MKHSVVMLFCGLLVIACPAFASTATPRPKPATTGAASKVTWIHPVIAGYGGVHPRPDAAVQPVPNAEYKVIVDVVHGSKDPGKVPDSLIRLARTVNLLGYAKVPASHVHVVAVLEGEAMMAAMSNATYRKQFKRDNPSLKLLHELKQAGIQLLVCSQALAGGGYPDSAVAPDVTVSLSALSDFVVYGQRGYSYMQL